MRTDRARGSRLLTVGAAAIVAATLVHSGCRRGGDGDAGAPVEVAVHVGAVARATLHRYVEAYGRVEPAPPSEVRSPARAIIGAPVGGLLTGIECSEGQRVREGEVLFALDSRAAEVAAAKARTALEYAERTLERQRELLEAGGVSQRAVQDAEQQRDAARNELATAATQLDLLRITAPVAGTVVRINAALGQPVEPNTILAEIVDLDRLVVAAAVPSPEARDLVPGQPVELAADGSVLGPLVFIGDKVDPSAGTVVIRASLPAGSGLRPGEFLEIRVVAEVRPDCLAVPVASVVTREGEGSWVMVVDGDTATRTAVTAGIVEDGMVEISGSGIGAGTTIVTEGAYGLPPEAKIRIVSD